MRTISPAVELVCVEDPARFAFAHGGKDGHPYRVDRKTYDQSIQIIQSQLRQIPDDGGGRPGVLREAVERLLTLGSEDAPRS